MNNVTKFWPKDAAKDPDAVLEQAIGQYEDVIVLGYDGEGNMDARATLSLSASDILWLLERFKMGLISGEYCE